MTTSPAFRLSAWLQSIFNIQPGEGARVAAMILYSAAAVGGVLTVGLTVSSTLFVSQLPAADMPYLFILPAIFIVPALLLYNRISARFRLDQVIIGSNAMLLGGMLIFRLLLATPFGKSFAALAALYLFEEIAYTLVILQFWSLAGQVFNPREARRLFGLMAAGGTVANIAAGFSLAAVAKLIGVENLLWGVVLALGICIACAWALGRWQRGALKSTTPTSRATPAGGRKSFVQDLRAIRQSPLLLAIGGLTLLLSLLINIGAYQFFLSLQIKFAGHGSEMAAYLGAYEFWAGLAAFVTQFYLTGWVLSRFGVFVALMFFPLGTVLGAGWSLIAGGALLAMTLIRAADPIFRRTINSAALNVLYLPTPANVRERAKELFEGMYAAAFGLAGVVFLLLQRVPGWNYLYYSIPLLGLAAAWVALLPWTRRQYTRALADSLKRRLLDLEGATINISDETTVRVLMAALQNPDELHVLHALQLIAGAPAVNWDPYVVPLLAHLSPVVRLSALQHLGRSGNTGCADAVAALFAAPEAEVRAAAIETYCAAVGSTAAARVGRFLLDDDPHVRSAVVAGLIRHGGQTGFEFAIAELKEMLGSGDAAMRHAAVHAIGLASLPDLSPLLVPLFDDADLEIQLGAVRAAGALHSRDLLPHLIRKLGDKPTASAAVEALAHYTSGIEPELGAALEDPALGAYVPRILYRLRTRPALDLLLAHFHTTDESARDEIYRALARLRAEGVAFELPEAELRAALLGELRGGYALIVLREDLGKEGLDALLADAIRARLSRTLDRAFHLLNLLYPNHTQRIQRVRQALEAEQSNTRALAVELLDNLAEPQVKDLLLPLVEAPVERLLEIARKRFGLERRSVWDRLGELAEGPDPWLRTCAVFRIGALKRIELTGAVLAALDSGDMLLRETALAASRTLFDPTRFHELLTSHAADDRFPVVRRYAQSLISDL